MTEPERHEHDWWRTPGGALECSCGKSRTAPTEGKTMAVPELTEAEKAAKIERFGFDVPPSVEDSIEAAVICALNIFETSDPDNRIYSNETKVRISIDMVLAELGFAAVSS